MNKMLYILGFIIVVAALAYGATVLGVPGLWIGIGAALLIGLALIGAASKTSSSTTTTVEHAPRV